MNVKEMSTVRAAPERLYNNPKQRAEDLNQAFADPNIKGIFCSIGGDDAIRILPYLDKELILRNPKVVIGSSDNTTFLAYLNQLGLVTFYGPTVMAGISQIRNLDPLYKRHVVDLLFQPHHKYEYSPFDYWSQGYPDWSNTDNIGKINEKNQNTEGWKWLQGDGIKSGRLFGGNIEVFEMMKGTTYFPEDEFFDDKVLFLENGEGTTTVNQIKRMLRNYGVQRIFERIRGLIFGRARDYSPQERDQLDNVITSVIQQEFNQYDLPIISNFDFGHTDPMSILPLGVPVEVNCEEKRIMLMEPSVL
ncbi:LD-carboxypeptidase [Virgibacillus sp. NKC19-3]|nr:LD-carboxypeptidase [Virgibacillus sp. NKC19-3]